MRSRNVPLILPSLRAYRASWLRPDVVAGLTLVAIAVPEQIATAKLAYMPATAGLYAFMAGSLLYAVLGRSGQMSVGADSTIAPILAAGVAGLAAAGTPRYVHLVSFLTLMAGALVIANGLLRLGWLSEFLSTPVITGVLAGIAVQIAVRQIPAILGLPGGGSTLLARLQKVAEQIGHANVWSIAIAAAVFALVVLAEHVDRRIPGALIGFVLSILAVAVLGLTSHGVAVLGPIHGGVPAFALPSASLADVRQLIGPALTVAFVCLAQTSAVVRATGASSLDAGEMNRDLVAIGTGSLAAGLTGSFAVNSSPPRTQVVLAAGGRSQLTGVIAAVLVFAVVLAGPGLLKDLPDATLGAILLFIATRLFRAGDLKSIRRFDRLEFALAVAALLAVSLFGIETGVVVALLLSLADRTRRAARPSGVILGREPGTDHWIPPDIGRPTEQVPGVLVFLIYAPLWYGNAEYVRLRILQMLDTAAEPVHALVLDANGISDIDYTAIRMLGELLAELKQRKVAAAIARSSHLIHRELKRSGLLQSLDPDQLSATVEEAVNTLVAQTEGPGGHAGTVSAAGQRIAGQWPGPEALIARLADGFKVAARHETDPKQRKRLRRVSRTLSGAGHDLAVEVAADAIAPSSELD
ncbi:MAG TPA: SulP family inorganic anion transporter [Streptosporangiaceae bacterium]|nr:SulP family inorganic anion transporter [Streptosporangiaceae bacterium]